MSRFMNKYTEEEFSENFCYNQTQINNKIQCFASKFGLNNIFEDVHNIQKQGCFVFEMISYKMYGTDKMAYDFSLRICMREEKRGIQKRDYSFSTPHSHLFFEIPIIRTFDEEKIKNWQLWAFDECKKLLTFNQKKRDSWLKKKKMMEDFADDEF